MNARGTVSLAAFTAVVFSGVMVAIAAGPNIGQDQSAVQGPPAGIIENLTLVGATVLNPQGEKLGQIKHVLLDAQAGQATFVVIGADASGSSRAILVVPYQALKVNFNAADNRQSVVLDRRPDQLRTAPRIQNNQWEMLRNPQFLEQARNFYQVKTYYTAARPIDSASPPSLPPSPLVPCPVPQVNADSGWSQDLEDFYNE